MSTFDQLITELTRDYRRVQPKDSLQFCANWFQSRLEEQRARTRDTLSSMSRPASLSHELPSDHYMDTTPSTGTISPFSQAPSRPRASIYDNGPSPFGTLNVPGNALFSPLDTSGANTNRLVFQFDDDDSAPQAALAPPALTNPFASFAEASFAPASGGPGDFLHPHSSMIYARRTSVSAESIDVDGAHEEPLPYFPKSEEQLRRIKASITSNLIFRDLDEEQELGVLNAMQEQQVSAEEVVIRQGDVGEYFYVVERGLLHCYIRPDPLPPTWLTGEAHAAPASTPPGRFTQPGDHPIYGKKVAECRQGNSFGELALMYGHPRAATVLSIEPSTLWSLDRITFRTIILKAAHKRRTMYEHFLSSVPMLTSLEPGERSKIADALVSRVVADGEPVVRQGDMGDTFFFVEEGEAVITKEQIGEGGSAHEVEIGRYHKGDYFGELSLLRLAPRAATVAAVRRTDPSQPKLKVAGLDAQAFTRLLGPLREIMERKASENYGPTYNMRR